MVQAQTLPKLPMDSLHKSFHLGLDSTLDSNSKSFRKYTVIIDTVYTEPYSLDTLKSLRIGELRPSHFQDYPNYKRRGVFNPIPHFRWHSYWRRSIENTFNFSEGAFSSNWKSGGTNSISLGLNFDAHSDYAKENISFTNELMAQLGGIDSKGLGIRKSLDKVFLDSKLGYKLRKYLFLFSSGNFQSQFINGYAYSTNANNEIQKTKISGILAPGYLTESMGMEYKPNLHQSSRLGLVSLRQVFVVDTGVYHGTPSNYGVPIGKRGSTEIGFQLISDFHQDIMKNVNLKTHLEFFQSYKQPSNTNLRMDAYLVARVNRLVNMNLSGTVLYDNNQDPHPQFNQFLSLGITYRYSEQKQN